MKIKSEATPNTFTLNSIRVLIPAMQISPQLRYTILYLTWDPGEKPHHPHC